jgi:hypothetical protein
MGLAGVSLAGRERMMDPDALAALAEMLCDLCID